MELEETTKDESDVNMDFGGLQKDLPVADVGTSVDILHTSTRNSVTNGSHFEESLPELVAKDTPEEQRMDDFTKTKEPSPIMLEIERWKSYNNYVALEVVNIREAPEYQIIFTIGPEGIPFQLFANDRWEPMFLTSESPILQEHTVLINAQIEEQNQSQSQPFTLTNLLNMFGLAFNDSSSKPYQRPSNPFANYHIPETSYVADDDLPPAIPTQEDWERLLLPELRNSLERENFQRYEIDEWLRRVSIQVHRGDYNRALDIYQYDILGGAVPTGIISRFFSRKPRHSRNNTSFESEDKFITIGGSAAATERLKSELVALKELSTEELGFTAKPSGNDLYHWHINLFGFGSDSLLGQQLTEWALHHTQTNDQAHGDILIEMKFPSNYPEFAPFFRIIRPRFRNLDVNLTLPSDMNGEGIVPEGRKSLTVSRALEKSKSNWNTETSITDLVQQIRSFIIDSGASVDMDCGVEGYSLPTLGCFWRSYSAVAPKTYGKTELENGGKVILPPSALEELSQFDLERSSDQRYGGYNDLRNSGGTSSPWIFEISTTKGRRSFCGIEEFTSQEGFAIVPEWILQNLQAKEGDQLQLRRVSLPRGTYLKLQPHTADFLEVNDTKAMLEWVLPRFVVMSAGDTIVVPYRNKAYLFNVLEVKPGRAIHIIDSEIATDFAPPLSGDIKTFSTSETTPVTSDDFTVGSPKKPNELGSKLGTSPSKGSITGILQQDNQVEGVDFKVCDNCRHRIPFVVYPNHSLSCARRNWFCEACGDVVEKSQKEQHMRDFHTLLYCECGQQVEIRNLESHKVSECPRRIVQCEYCPLEMPYVEKFEHERKCGSQTEKCELCGKYVKKQDFPFHVVDCQKPEPAWKPQNFYQPQKRTQDLMVCPICDASFWHLDDVQVHMLTSHDTEERMEEEPVDKSAEVMDEGLQFGGLNSE